MTQRKILIYGGCHALILRDLLARHFPDEVDARLIVNFEQIRSGLPFAYERLRDFDAVFFSPIENKKTYNTSYLLDACRAVGVEAFCYPWLEWHGYSPRALKGEFKNRFQWRYEGLSEAASSFETFEHFVEWVRDAYPDGAELSANFESTTALLRGSERRHDMPIRIADYILENYRSSRLFLVPDHPALKLYVHVLRQMLALLGISGDARCSSLGRQEEEPQRQWRMPILPRVQSGLDLRFSDQRWIDEDIAPGRVLDLRSYLLLYYHRQSVILGPTDSAVVWNAPDFDVARNVDPTIRLLADRVIGPADGAREEYRFLGMLSGGTAPVEPSQSFRIDKLQWRSAWG